MGCKLKNTVAILALFMSFNVLLDLDALMNVSHIQKFWIFHREVLHNFFPSQASEGWLLLRLICNNNPVLNVLFFKIPSIDIMFLFRHLLKSYGAHVVIVTVVDVSFIRVLKTSFESFDCCLWSEFAGDILRSFWLIEDSSGASYSKVLA